MSAFYPVPDPSGSIQNANHRAQSQISMLGLAGQTIQCHCLAYINTIQKGSARRVLPSYKY